MGDFWRDDIALDQEPAKIKIIRHAFTDEDRDRRLVKTKIYAPVGRTDGPFPVILWSHGLGGSVDGASFLARFLAAHGYIIVNVQHHGTDSSLWEGEEGHPWDIIRKQVIPRSATLNRFQDIPFILKELPAYFEAHDDIEANMESMGMSGHSFGALTTQVMGGMLFPEEDGKLRSFKQDVFKAGIAYSPNPIEHLGLDAPEDIYGGITLPLFHMTGTADDSPVENWDYQKRLVVYKNSPQSAHHLLVIQDGDHMVFNGSRGKLGANPNKEKHEGIIKIAALAYWDMMLKADQAAQDWFLNGGFKNWLGAEGEFS